jgi:hypothetical protein
VHLVAGRVQELGLVEEPQTGGDDADRRVLERPHEPVECPRSDDRVGVEEDERVAGRIARALVGATREAQVPSRGDDPDAVARRRRVDLGPAAAVVDDDDLVGLEGVEQPPERLAGAVGDDDDALGQYAPRAATTAGIVRSRIEMSSQIDQFSR